MDVLKFAFVLLIAGAGAAQDGTTHSIRPSAVTQRVDPDYSSEARAARLQGTAQLYIELDDLGVPDKIEVLQGLGLGLDARAIAAVKQWTFRPATRDDGTRIPSALTTAVRFLLGDSPSWRITRAAYTVQVPPGRWPPRPKSKPILEHYSSPPDGVCAETKKVVQLQLTIDEQGTPHRVVSSDTLDDSPALRAAMEAAGQWRYAPATFDGMPAPADAFLELECNPATVPLTTVSTSYLAGRDIPMPAAVSAAQPDYNEEAYTAGIEGNAQYAVAIDTAGRVTNVSSLYMIGHGLDQNAMDSILRWRFRPPLKDGKPVNAIARLQTTWKIEKGAASKQ